MPEDDGFEMIPVESSQIAEVGFNSATGKGRILFSKNGSLYEYDGCTQEEFQQIVNAPSVGQEFAALWKPKPYQRLG